MFSTDTDHPLALFEIKVATETGSELLNASAYEITQLSRHPERPNVLEYINLMTSSFIELHGDRNFEDDPDLGRRNVHNPAYVDSTHKNKNR